MARTANRLTVPTIRSIVKRGKPGEWRDGLGLMLRLRASGPYWVYEYMLHRKPHDMGLGRVKLDADDPKGDFTLAEARELAREARKLVKQGIDPIKARKADKRRLSLEAARAKTFRQCADEFLELNEGTWRSSKHRSQWRTTLETYAYPVIGSMPVHEIDTTLVMRILRPLWTGKLETGKRLQLRIDRVIEYARSHGYSDKPNPATWFILKHILPAPGNKPKRMEAMPFVEVPAYVQMLAGCDRIQAQALRFLILTAARSEEVRGARWEEIDLEAAVWDIPAERMKGHRRHRVPLSAEAVTLLKGIERRGDYVFSHTGGRTKMGKNAMWLELRTTHENVDVHGYRSAFKTWAAEATWMPNEVVEMSLAHKIKDKTEEAYWRTDILAKRALLMTMWANHCTRVDAGAEIIALKRPELIEAIG